jgi:hypothetical protein
VTTSRCLDAGDGFVVKGTVGQRETTTGVCFFDGLSTKVGLRSIDEVGKYRDEIGFVGSL